MLVTMLLFSGNSLSQVTSVCASGPETLRGRILDAKGVVLAESCAVNTYVIPVSNLHSKSEHYNLLASAFTEEKLIEAASQHKDGLMTVSSHVHVDDTILPEGTLIKLGQEVRKYYHEHSTEFLIGRTNKEHQGISGIEKSQNEQLRNGIDIKLSINIDVQNTLHEQLTEQVKRFEAIGGGITLLEIQSGKILSLNSVYSTKHQNFNFPANAVFEFGSALKPFNYAIGHDTNGFKTTDLFDTKPFNISGFRIYDYIPMDRKITAGEGLLYSSSVVSAQIASAFSVENQKSYLNKLGLLSSLDLGIPVHAPLVPDDWNNLTKATLSYGHGIAVTQLHLAQAYARLVSSTPISRTSLLLSDDAKAATIKPVFSKSTNSQVRQLLRLNVSSEEGTGNFADVANFLVGGKTGTAAKLIHGYYPQDGYYDEEKFITTFAAVFPAHEPEYVVIVSIDEPKGQEFSYGYATAGWTAAPVIHNSLPLIKDLINFKEVQSLGGFVWTSGSNDQKKLFLTDDLIKAIPYYDRGVKSSNDPDENSLLMALEQVEEAKSFHYGINDPVDYKKALTNYELANQISPTFEGLLNQAALLRFKLNQDSSSNSSYKILREAARLQPSNAEVNFLLFDHYFNGIGTERSVAKALRYLTDAANFGLPEAARKLAEIYKFGMNVEVDNEKSSYWANVALSLFETKSAAKWSSLTLQDIHPLLSNETHQQPQSNLRRDDARYLAILIGANNYEFLPNLRTPINDVENIGELLANKFGFETKILKNPARAEITSLLNHVSRELETSDTLIIYYAGHGVEKNGDGYWVPSDGDRDDDTNWISNDYVTRKIKNIKAKNILVISDSCFSGTLSRGISIPQNDNIINHTSDALKFFKDTKSRVVITSGNLEPVMDGGGGNNSVFANAILQKLTKTETALTATELFNFASKTVVTNSLNLGDVQSPTFANLPNAGHVGPDVVMFPN